MLSQSEHLRLSRVYDDLRKRLLDLTKKNRMLSYPVGAKTKRQLQIIDEVLEEVYARLTGTDTALRVIPLEEPATNPDDEKSDEFQSALAYARLTDVEYLTAMKAQEAAGGDNEAAQDRLERKLRDRIRAELGMKPRPKRAEINRNDHARDLGINPNPELEASPFKKSHADNQLQTLKYPDELDSIMDKVAGDARLAEQELGVSTLFLAFGFLEMYESDVSEKAMYAPLLLLPVKVVKTKVRGKDVYSIAAREDGAEANISLREYLKERFARDLPDFDADEEAGGTIEGYLAQARQAVDGLGRWRIRRWLVLGHFAFSRIAIFHDTDPMRWRDHPAGNRLVGSLLKGYDEGEISGPASFHPPDDYHIDDPEIERLAPILIQDADASQHSALVDVMKGKNLVIQGPPGTGKSQTITNIIANVLSAGKTVLFLAEKQAALNVVKHRLDKAGLGDFCLELHSDKVAPKTLIESLRLRHELGIGRRSSNRAGGTDPTWASARAQISGYLGDLHKEADDGATPFNLFWKSIRGRGRHRDIPASWNRITLPPDLIRRPSDLRLLAGQLAVYGDQTRAYISQHGNPVDSPWFKTPPLGLNTYDHDAFFAALADIRKAVGDHQKALIDAADLGARTSAEIATVAVADARLGEPLAHLALLREISTLDLSEFGTALDRLSRWLTAKSATADTAHLSPGETDLLPLAAKIAVRLSEEQKGRTPQEFYRQSRSAISGLQELVDLVEPLTEIAVALGCASVSIRAADALAAAALVLSRIASEQLPWIGIAPADAAAFEAFRERWAAISAEEQLLRAGLPGLSGAPWPDAARLEAAAEAIETRGLLTRIRSLFRKSESFDDLAQRIGVPPGHPDTAGVYRRIAAHKRARDAFEADPAYGSLLAAEWRGLETHVAQLAQGIQLRRHILSVLEPLPRGRDVADRLLSSPPQTLAAVARVGGAADRYWKSRDRLAQWMTHDDLASGLARARRRIDDLTVICRLDPEESLAVFGRTFAELADLHRRVVQLREADTDLTAAKLGDKVLDLCPSAEAVASAREAVDWIQSVKRSSLPKPLLEGLLDERAGSTRIRIRQIAREIPAQAARRDAALAAMAQFRCHGLAELSDTDLLTHLDALDAARDSLADFVPLARERQGLVAKGLGDCLGQFEALQIPPDQWVSFFETVAAHVRADAARRTSQALGQVSGAGLEANRNSFAERDRTKIATDRQIVRDVLLRAIPPEGRREGAVKQWTQMHLLANEFPKQRRFTPVRGLLERAGGAVQALKPCFMMSPLSLAKFLPANALRFDILIIDEASQMRPEDALGAMLRANQIVVVGDQKQLPPTDFFSRSDAGSVDDDDDGDDLDDESILERCQKVYSGGRQLKWHYRSRCESLIRFSNAEFYHNNLITFPAARPGSFSVDLIRVDGAYQERRNVAEAERVAEEAIRFMRHHMETSPDKVPTLGIVALNSDQKDLIQEIFHRYANDDLVEAYLEKTRSEQEEFFIKNLENVQGDERDYIFISMTYGKAPGSAALRQTFGPIIKKQGHRRLNVLFSRARVRMAVFSSFGSVDIRPSPTSNEGPRVLQRFLEFVETRGRASVQKIGGEADSDFEIEVAERLRAGGYEVDLQIGVSGYRIDLGVRHPGHPEHFLAGIECDGAAYHSSKSARDRDRIRQQVLEGLGWHLLRVWSTDWFDDPERQTRRLVAELERLAARPPEVSGDYIILAPTSPLEEAATVASEPLSTIEQEGGHIAAIPALAGESLDRTALPAVATAPAELRHQPDPDAQKLSAQLDATGSLTDPELVALLRHYRDCVIAPATAGWQAQRSILRDSMIETLVHQNITDPDEWFSKVPTYLRQGTDPTEKRVHLERICDLVARRNNRI